MAATDSNPQKINEYIERDISWLSFNYRVLQEAKDPNVPLLERVKFLAIYSSNLGEFFRVRVANHRNLIRLGKKTKKKLEYDPNALIEELITIVTRQMREFAEIFSDQIVPELRKNGINIVRRQEMNEEQLEFISQYFMDKMLPFCQPVLLYQKRIKPFLNDAELYLALDLRRKDKSGQSYYGIVKIPSDQLGRFLILPGQPGEHNVIMLDDVVRQNASILFPGFEIEDSYSIKLTRDAELYIDDEYSGNLLQKIKTSLEKRNVGPASRLVYDEKMPQRMLDHLVEVLDLVDSDLIPESRYHNNFDFFKFPDFGKIHLKDTKLPPLPYDTLEKADAFFLQIQEKDHLIKFPYQSYESVVRFFEQAADDPDVTHIKVVQYRVAKKSRIMDALIRAARNGKNVFVFIEVKARFDEEANLAWGEKLEKAGVKIRYSFPGLKVHAKIALVRKVTNHKVSLFTYSSTGNFHEDTARLYTDFGLFTADPRITKEIARVFRFLETVVIPEQGFKHLLVGQFNLYDDLIKMVESEITAAENGEDARIYLKLNSLQDKGCVDLLQKAAKAGVDVRLIVRGICTLKPNPAFPNLKIISIVDRFLEHSRIYYFYQSGTPKLYISSADWMVRNLHHRIETAIPIYDEDVFHDIMDIFHMQWRDNVKARMLDGSMQNEYSEGESEISFRSQIETYLYYKRKTEQE